MKATVSWLKRPFKPYARSGDAFLPFVSRLVPDEGAFTIEWIDNGFDGEHRLTVRKRGADDEARVIDPVPQCITVDGLEDLTDYTVTLSRVGKEGSCTRLVRTGRMPCDVPVCYLHPDDTAFAFSGNFVAGPSIIKCPSGRLLASLDIFCGDEQWASLSQLYCSDDRGASWHWLGDLFPCYWGRLFVHKGSVYMFACTNGNGSVVIGRSDDEGKTWTAPVTLFHACYRDGYHSAPGSIAEHNGLLYFAVDTGGWGDCAFPMSVLTARADGDLLDPANWELADFTEYDPTWKGAPNGAGPGLGCPGAGIEGNVVIGAEGGVHALYRMDIFKAVPNTGKVLVFDVDPSDRSAGYRFRAIADCALGSNSKFCVKFDPISGKYLMIGTESTPEYPLGRTVISLAVSTDLLNWTVVKRLFDYSNMDPSKVGIQYPDWEFDGDDIIMLLRIGYNQSDTHHNSNCIAFSRIRDFRQYL